MMICPKCRSALVRCQNEFGNFWHCAACEGTAVTVSLLRKFVARDILNALWQDAKQHDYPRSCECPGCQQRMKEVPVATPNGPRQIDICSHCHFIWLDAGEWDDLPHAKVKQKETPASLPQEYRERLAIEKVRQINADHAARSEPGPSELWQWIPALLGLPFEAAEPLQRKQPWLTWMLSVVIVVVSVGAFFDLEAVVQAYGLIPAQAGRLGGLTCFSSFFLHGGVLHLLGNIYFLLILGDNVEDSLSMAKYGCLLIAAVLVGDFCHILLDPDSTVPCIGASGGISGVIAYYALRFPRSRMSLLCAFFFRPVWLRLDAIWLFALWVGLQFFTAWQQMEGAGHVSGGAHLGGALAGVLAWVLWRQPKLKPAHAEI